MSQSRADAARAFRIAAAELAHQRYHPEHAANPDEQRYGAACYPMSFTKGLEHDCVTGLVTDPAHFEAFRTAIDNAFAEPFTTRVPVPRRTEDRVNSETGETETVDVPRRKWEAPTAGVVFELEGPDPQAVTMPPAPELGSDELAFEMAEVYELALLRDVAFTAFEEGGAKSAALDAALDRLNELTYVVNGYPGRPRLTDEAGLLNAQSAFRGSSPGVEVGPYLSQFMLIGNEDAAGARAEDGFVSFGAQRIDQRVLVAATGDNYMMRWEDWLTVQNGFDVRPAFQNFTGDRRFITTPRDLATYVHIDALYQAYLNACLLLLGQGTPFDPAFDLLSGSNGHQVLVNAATGDSVDTNAGGFALWGGPHILSLVTEVATRGLKAVRFQKFNNHLRLRPEALAGRIEKAAEIDEAHPSTFGAFTELREALEEVVEAVRSFNNGQPNGEESALLPMAFAEGSPMHPTYGAGHATVAGACVTMLKAYFDTSAVFARITRTEDCEGPTTSTGFFGKRQLDAARAEGSTVTYGSFAVVDDGQELEFIEADYPLTLEGELNKLAANISIGRNMAGVHYYSDYFDSVRMGEEIAIGILEEQALGYQTDRFVLSVPTFDGEVVRIGAR